MTQRDGNYSSFTDVLRASISILVHNSDVHEVLFNSQWNRNCSLGIMSFCDPKLLAAGGWFKMNHNDWGFPYSLHEFGISPRPVFTDNESHELQRRRHDFSYWPGFSLNPGLWDLSKLKGIIKRQEFCQVESGISKKPVKSDTNSMYQCCNLFSESDPSFEHQFALLGHLHGVQVAYLHAVLFSHIGVDMSAYKLNGFFRPWD